MTTGGAMDRPIKRSFARRHRRLLIGAGLCAIAALSVVLVSASLSRRSVRLTAANLTISQVSVGAYHDSIPLQGKVAAHDTVLLDALAGGRVDRVLALPGDMVQKGSPWSRSATARLNLTCWEREARLIEVGDPAAILPDLAGTEPPSQ